MEQRILIGGQESEAACIAELKACRTFHFAMAWAQDNTSLASQMQKVRAKARLLVVGTTGGFTDPEFVEDWKDKRIRVHIGDDELFHPKVMLFENERSWSAVVGSANATRGGLSREAEAGVFLRGDKSRERGLFKKLRAALRQWWRTGQTVNSSVLDEIRELKRRRPQSKGGGNKSDVSRFLPQADWGVYFSRISATSAKELKDRVDVLAYLKPVAARRFDEISREELRKLLGTVKGRDGEPDWRYFGHVALRKGRLPELIGITKNDPPRSRTALADCLEEIPISGTVTYQQFQKFSASWQRATGSIASATVSRLLAMRRPDIFLCVTSRSRLQFSKEWDTPKYKIYDLRFYWDAVVAPIQNSSWWRTPEPEGGLALEVWQGRVALLDSIYYV